MPLGSSSDAPVTSPGPSALNQLALDRSFARFLTDRARALFASFTAASVWQNRELTNCPSTTPAGKRKRVGSFASVVARGRSGRDLGVVTRAPRLAPAARPHRARARARAVRRVRRVHARGRRTRQRGG